MYNIKKEEIKTAKDSFLRRTGTLGTLDFFVDRFLDYAHDQDYKEKIKDLFEKFQVFLKDHVDQKDPNDKSAGEDIRYIVDSGVLFLMTNPMFSVHEFVDAGAMPSTKEAENFLLEMAIATTKGSQREKLLPYAAVVGYTLLQHLAKEAAFKIAVEKRLASMHDIVGANILKAFVKSEIAPQQKALVLCDQLESMGITIDANGKVNDPEKLLEQDDKSHQRIWKMRNNEPEN